ncbi:FKBP-type peptidyl-prolyl cis-trans isomerase [Flavobacterium sp. UBA6135]|uniref:FKBP-type peptidyl-prolyl cis-trans isomerase n=1 Tax=Flavobacterium sp. UBA6135 TaxID=1946553 RepID=UPI0025B8D854|nr:FKBP-type peptidylprolyl isomerase [Flavobacterium sp. UBA6135]
MNRIKAFLYVMLTVGFFTACNKDDDRKPEPLRDFAEQYAKDFAEIETYLETHYITVTNNPGFQDDMDVVIEEIPEGGTQTPIKDHPDLKFRMVTSNGVEYKVYYLKLREGIAENPSPTNVDAVLASYKGTLLNGTQFDYMDIPSTMLRLDNVIRGWSEIFPQFKTGNYITNGDGTVSFTDFGAGVMFIPSGLGYFNLFQTNIPSYSPLVFSFKLYEIERIDHDNDGIPSYLEDINGDGYLTNEDDTDGDGIPDYRDIDDDADGRMTKDEIKDAEGNIIPYADIPDCNGNTTDPNRLRKHLDPNCN